MCRKPAVTISPSELISPCSSALVATVVPWASPATSSVVAPAAVRISLTPRTSPIAGVGGVVPPFLRGAHPRHIIGGGAGGGENFVDAAHQPDRGIGRRARNLGHMRL